MILDESPDFPRWSGWDRSQPATLRSSAWEAQALRSAMIAAKRKVDAALKRERQTSCQPPTAKSREEAMVEYRYGLAIAEEFGL